jgi:hypothetical protein
MVAMIYPTIALISSAVKPNAVSLANADALTASFACSADAKFAWCVV